MPVVFIDSFIDLPGLRQISGVKRLDAGFKDFQGFGGKRLEDIARLLLGRQKNHVADVLRYLHDLIAGSFDDAGYLHVVKGGLDIHAHLVRKRDVSEEKVVLPRYQPV